MRSQIRKITSHSNHGKVVQRYIELSKKIESHNFLDRLSLLSSLIVQPVGHLVFWVTFLFFPAIHVYFGGDLNSSMFRKIFYIISTLQVLWACYCSWNEVIEHQNLSTTLMIWKLLTIRLGVPMITIKSKDKNHQLYTWSAGAHFLSTVF